MKPDWDKLGDEYAASSSVVIADVDCTVEEKLCQDYDVKGYPTIKYFMGGTGEGEDYSSGRDYESMKTFVTDTLEIMCNVNDLSADGGCTDKEIGYIEKMKSKSEADRNKQLLRLQTMKDDPMKSELKVWLRQRMYILQSLHESSNGEL